MFERNSELDAFKKLNLSVIASAYGYVIDRKKSTRHSVLMSNGSDKIIISQNGQHYIYCSVHNPDSNGTAIDFAQKAIEPGCSLGRVRQLLRPFLSSDYRLSIESKYSGQFATEIKPSEMDLLGVAARYARFDPIAQPHPYLCQARGIPFELLQSNRLKDQIRHCPRRGSVAFPHWGRPKDTDSEERCLVGYEIKGQGINRFSKGGRKGLWISAAKKGDQVLAFTESGLDAVSYLAARGTDRTRIASLSGKMNRQQPTLIQSAIEKMGQGSLVVAAFDNDKGGDELTEKLAQIVNAVNRNDLEFKEDRPLSRGADWNQVQMEEAKKMSPQFSWSPQFGR